eukprot:2401046-Prymnesium_polylepis.2
MCIRDRMKVACGSAATQCTLAPKGALIPSSPFALTIISVSTFVGIGKCPLTAQQPAPRASRYTHDESKGYRHMRSDVYLQSGELKY